MTNQSSLSGFLKEVLEQRHLSGNQLAQLAGISEGSVRNLLKQGVEDEVSGPHPLVLKAICQALQLDEIYVFQLAGYLSEASSTKTISPAAEYFGQRFDGLPPRQQKQLWETLAALEQSAGILPPSENTRYLLEQLRTLQKEHPMLKSRKFSLKDELGRVIGNVTHTSTPALIRKMTLERLHDATNLPPTLAWTDAFYDEVIGNPDVTMALNVLLPRKDISTPQEKLFWLVHPSGTLDKRFSLLADEYQQGIRALGELLVDIAKN